MFTLGVVSSFLGLFLGLLQGSPLQAAQPPQAIYRPYAVDIGVVQSDAELKAIKDLGFDAIQVFPLQYCRFTGDWRQFFEPLSYEIGNFLGTSADLQSLTERAHRLGLRIIVDVVLNHLAAPYSHRCFSPEVPDGLIRADHWRRSKSSPNLEAHILYERDYYYRDVLKKSPSTPSRLYDWEPTPELFKEWNEHGWGGDGSLPQVNLDLPEVQDVQLDFLRTLAKLGVDGFCFDAVERMSFQAIHHYLSTLRTEGHDLWSYSEMSEESAWVELMSMMDYKLLDALIAELSYAGSLAHLRVPPSTRGDSVTFTSDFFNWRSELLKDGKRKFPDSHDVTLATLFILARRDGAALILDEMRAKAEVQEGLLFRKEMSARKADYEFVAESETLCPGCSSQTFLMMDRGGEGLFFLNKGGQALSLDQMVLKEYPRVFGCYRALNPEGGYLQAGLHRFLKRPELSARIEIPARTGLFYIKVSDEECTKANLLGHF